MNHISRRTSRFYDIHDYPQLIFRVDFYYNAQWNSKKQNQGTGNDNSADTQNGCEHDAGPKKYKILRLFTISESGTDFTYYSIYISEDRGSSHRTPGISDLNIY